MTNGKGPRTPRSFDSQPANAEDLLPRTVAGRDIEDYLERLIEFASVLHLEVFFRDDLVEFARSEGAKIHVRAGLEKEQAFAVLVYELARRLLRDIESHASTNSALESQAGAVGYAVCAAIGLEVEGTGDDTAGRYDEPTDGLSDSMKAIHAAAASILEAISSPLSKKNAGNVDGSLPHRDRDVG